MNPIVINAVAIATLTGAIIDNFSYGVLFALVASVLALGVSLLAAARYARALAEAQAPAADLADQNKYGVEDA